MPKYIDILGYVPFNATGVQADLTLSSLEVIVTFTWSKQLSVGNRAIDYEHKNLHDIINGIVRSIVARDIAALLETFELLENCLCAYFVVEENIAQAIGFNFTQHGLAHQRLSNEFQFIKDELMTKDGIWSKHEEKGYIDSLMYCLIRHIKEDGKPFKAVLNTHLYDLKPSCAGSVPILHGCA